MTTSFPTDLRPELAPYIAREQAKNVVQLAHHRREAARSSGVSFGGLGPTPPVEVQVHDMVAAATAAYERDAKWKKSPRGRLSYAITAIRQAGYGSSASILYGYYSRDLADDRQPVNTHAVRMCLEELSGLPMADGAVREVAMQAVRALADLLGADEQRVA